MLLSKKWPGEICFENIKDQKGDQTTRKVKEPEKESKKAAKKGKFETEKKSDGKAKSKMEELLQKKGERSIQCKDSTAISSKVIIDNWVFF